MNFRISFEEAIHPELVAELEKSVTYASAKLRSFRVTADGRGAEVECEQGARAEVTDKVGKLVGAMLRSFRSLGEPEEIARRTRRDSLPIESDAFAELEKRKWVRVLGRGQVSLAGGAYALRRFLDEAVRDVAKTRFSAEDEDHPALLDTEVLVRCGYFRSFPHSVCFASHFVEDFDAIESFRAANAESDTLAVPEPSALTHSDAVLRPAVCLPVYRELEGASLPPGGITITTSGKAFRYESRNMAGLKRLWDFSMREIVFVGSAEDVEGQRTRMIEAVTSLMDAWDLGGRLVAASDPFFATVRGAKALWQRSRAAKYEMMVEAGPEAIAAGSINFAGTLFGDAFGIRTNEGEIATTACVGFGLERLVLALFSQHGFARERWPGVLREVVFG
ncbi:Archaeal seryl-tRNA synthetase-related sequence [Labilithrix luteola]|uniref:Archaeal seryl-tRNA synthetase-related sequence n=1 Tax=Labilithrix luteola TaxID=1391654 RepID=A0A0K1PYW2_9BACT|nr:aminoacyl--tRNA ligase-related protein [Labilithrix luteola]AKU98692.1 Archaeal seryl-tRNA synthetase-related sequence [Labilithrix luteola]